MEARLSDTTPEAEAFLIEGFRRLPAWRKLELVDDLRRTAMALALSGLRERFSNDSSDQLRRRLADLILGPELAAKVYGPPDYVS